MTDVLSSGSLLVLKFVSHCYLIKMLVLIYNIYSSEAILFYTQSSYSVSDITKSNKYRRI